jgi:hypothetical protein
MQIFVKLLDATMKTYEVEPTTTIFMIKKEIEIDTGMPPLLQHLVRAGKYLSNNYTLAHYNIEKESTLHMILYLHCGP